MSENPLLPHSKLRELHALMLRTRTLERKQKPGASREALLAATSIQLLPGDLLSADTGDLTAGQLAPGARKPRTDGGVIPTAGFEARMPLCAAAARGLQAAGSEGLVLALARAGSVEPGWVAALEWANASHLPLILAVADATGGKPSRKYKGRESALDYQSLSRTAKRLQMPVLTVDGEDVVAVYRVMQECVLRARMGGGPAVVWAVMTPTIETAKLPLSHQPLARLQQYMAARKIRLKA
ncbi:MAG: thiamine pyrophosphate-dependent enzyme [Acidobacteriaceae bacterium]